MADVPRVKALDSTLALRRDPYGFISKQAEALGSDVFEARILGRRTLCLTGRDAAEMFYDEGRVQRAGGAPSMMKRTLLGSGGVQGLDDAAHRARKALLLDVLAPERTNALVAEMLHEWSERLPAWEAKRKVVLYDEVRNILGRAVVRWAGLQVAEKELDSWVERVASLYEDAGSIGLGHLRARKARGRLEEDLAAQVQAVRDGSSSAPAGSALRMIAEHEPPSGERLKPEVAAVDLLNVLRPVTAVSLYVAHLAHALQTRGSASVDLKDPAGRLAFVHEVRRVYPLFPMVAGVVRHDFDWRGMHFAAGARLFFDLHGTNHDPRSWDHPERFDPARFLHRWPDPFAFVPQGGGDAREGHRCAGEEVTVALMDAALVVLVERVRYRLPKQDLSMRPAELPPVARSGIILRDVEQVGAIERVLVVP